MKQIVLTVLFLVGVGFGAVAQKSGDIVLKDVCMKKEAGNVQINFNIEIGKKATKSNYRLVLTPVLYNNNDSLRLKQIVVDTRKSRIVARREYLTAGKRAIDAVDEYRATNNAVVAYSYAVPYQEWMNEGDLRLDRLMCGCCTEDSYSSMLLAKNVALVPPAPILPPTPVVVEVPKQEVTENCKWEFSKKDMVIDFLVSRTYIDLNLFENKSILDEVVAALHQLGAKNVAIDRIEITGYASPEGGNDFNMKLGEGRSKALKQYLLKEVSELNDSTFVLINGGENWSRLREIVAASDMKYKEEVLDIIDNVPAEIDLKKNTSRKKQLMDLKGGVPYHYMVKNFYPRLRNACYIGVYYWNKRFQ